MQRGEEIFCPIRGGWVSSSPEEKVRQNLIQHLIGPFGCPQSLISVEVPLVKLVASKIGSIPQRRIDIVCFSRTQKGMAPLCLIECKVLSPKKDAFHQLNGYNFYIKAPYVALAFGQMIAIGGVAGLIYHGELASMPTYQDLQKKPFLESSFVV